VIPVILVSSWRKLLPSLSPMEDEMDKIMETLRN
jgi:hypothetical protein